MEIVKDETAAEKSHVLPEPVQAKIKQLGGLCDHLAQRLGYLKLEHERLYASIIGEIEKNHQEQRRLVNAAAETLGIDLSKERWALNADTMTLTRQEIPSANA